MRRLALALSIFIALANNLYGGERGRIPFLLNGESWRKLSQPDPVFSVPELSQEEKELVDVVMRETAKIWLIQGIYEGVWSFKDSQEESGRDVYYYETDYEQLVSAVDQFYSDSKNIRIPVVQALRIITMELRGEKKAVINKELRTLRMAIHIAEDLIEKVLEEAEEADAKDKNSKDEKKKN